MKYIITFILCFILLQSTYAQQFSDKLPAGTSSTTLGGRLSNSDDTTNRHLYITYGAGLSDRIFRASEMLHILEIGWVPTSRLIATSSATGLHGGGNLGSNLSLYNDTTLLATRAYLYPYMDLRYYTKSQINTSLALKVNYSDTAAMLSTYVHSVSGGYVLKSGDTMTGALNLPIIQLPYYGGSITPISNTLQLYSLSNDVLNIYGAGGSSQASIDISHVSGTKSFKLPNLNGFFLMPNVMSAYGDIMYAGGPIDNGEFVSNLSIGSEGQVLTVTDGAPAWGDGSLPSGSGFTNGLTLTDSVRLGGTLQSNTTIDALSNQLTFQNRTASNNGQIQLSSFDSSIGLFSLANTGPAQSEANITPSMWDFVNFDGSGNTYDFRSTGILTDNQNHAGIAYGGNYHANFSGNSLIDLSYSDSVYMKIIDTASMLSTYQHLLTGPGYVKQVSGSPTYITNIGITDGGTGNTTGTATINANLTGPITSVGNATSLGKNIALNGLTPSAWNANKSTIELDAAADGLIVYGINGGIFLSRNSYFAGLANAITRKVNGNSSNIAVLPNGIYYNFLPYGAAGSSSGSATQPFQVDSLGNQTNLGKIQGTQFLSTTFTTGALTKFDASGNIVAASATDITGITGTVSITSGVSALGAHIALNGATAQAWGTQQPTSIDINPANGNAIYSTTSSNIGVGGNGTGLIYNGYLSANSLSATRKLNGNVGLFFVANNGLQYNFIPYGAAGTGNSSFSKFNIDTIGNETITGNIRFIVGSDATNDMYYRNSGGTLNRIAAGTTGQFLSNTSGVPAWQTTLGVANGGTGLSSLTAGSLLYAFAPTTVSQLAIGGANQYLSSSGSFPAWTSADTAPTSSSANLVTSGGVYTAINNITIADSAYFIPKNNTGTYTVNGSKYATGTWTFNNSLLTNSLTVASSVNGNSNLNAINSHATGNGPIFGGASTSSNFAVDIRNNSGSTSLYKVLGDGTAIWSIAGQTLTLSGNGSNLTLTTSSNALNVYQLGITNEMQLAPSTDIRIFGPSYAHALVLKPNAITADIATFIPDTSGTLALKAYTPQVVAYADLTGQTSVGTVTSFTPTSTGTYSIYCYMVITAISINTLRLTCTYTDETNTLRTINISGIVTTTGSTNPGVITIRALTGTAITIATTNPTSSGSDTFDAGGVITQLHS